MPLCVINASCSLCDRRLFVIEYSVRFREPGYAVLSAVWGFVTVMLGMLTILFALAGIGGALNQTVPHGAARLEAILICFVMAIVFALLAVVCGRLTYKCMRAASRE